MRLYKSSLFYYFALFTAPISKHSEMITLVHKSCVSMLVFPLDAFRLPMEMSKFRRNLRGVVLNWDA